MNYFYSSGKNFTAIEKTVLTYMESHSQNLREMTIQQVAEANFTSKSTIFRLAKKLGFQGYTDMVYRLSQSANSIDAQTVDQLVAQLTGTIGTMFVSNEETLNDFITVIESEPTPSFYIIGTGYSGIIGEYIYKKLLGKGELVIYSNGADTNALFLNNLHRITHILCLSKSGETELINSKAALAQAEHKKVISFSHSKDNSLARLSDIAFVIEDNQFLDNNNINSTQFYALLMVYLEYCLDKVF